jgi:hypothetical protein
MALVSCAFIHVKHYDAAAVRDANALLDHFVAPLHAYLRGAFATAGATGDGGPDSTTLLMALVVWRECVARGAAAGRWQPGFESESEQQRVEGFLLASFASTLAARQSFSSEEEEEEEDERLRATRLLLGHIASGSAAGSRFFAWLTAHSGAGAYTFQPYISCSISYYH